MNLDDPSSRGVALTGALPAREESGLDVILSRVRKNMTDASVGHLRAAIEIVPLADVWEEQFQKEAECDWSHWVNKHFGRGAVRRFTNLYRSFNLLKKYWKGTDLTNRFHQDFLIYVAGSEVPDDKRKPCLDAVRAAAIKDGLPMLGKVASIRIARSVCGKQRAPRRTVSEKEKMRALWKAASEEIVRLGGVVPSVPTELNWIE